MRRLIINHPLHATLLAVALMVGLLVWARGARDTSALSTIAIGAVYPTSVSPPYTGALAIDVRSGHVFVATTTGIRVLDMRTGAVLRTIPRESYGVGYGEALALAADMATGHIIVVTGGGIQVLDSRTGAPIHSVATPMYPIAVAVDQRVGHAFVVGGAAL